MIPNGRCTFRHFVAVKAVDEFSPLFGLQIGVFLLFPCAFVVLRALVRVLWRCMKILNSLSLGFFGFGFDCRKMLEKVTEVTDIPDAWDICFVVLCLVLWEMICYAYEKR